MGKVYSSPLKSYLLRNGYIPVSNLLIDYQQQLGISEEELIFLIKVLRHRNGFIIHDEMLDPTVSSRTLTRRRTSLKEKNLINYTIVKKKDVTGLYKTSGISYDLTPLEEKLQIISDSLEKEKEKDIEETLTKEKIKTVRDEDLPLENYKDDFKAYYGYDFILNEYECNKYNSLSTDDKEYIKYIFAYCKDNNLLEKITPRLSLFFKVKFRFEELKKYCHDNGLVITKEEKLKLSIEKEVEEKRKELIEYFNNKYNSNGIDKISKIIDRAIYLSPNDDYETIDNTIKTYLKINEIKEIYNEEC